MGTLSILLDECPAGRVRCPMPAVACRHCHCLFMQAWRRRVGWPLTACLCRLQIHVSRAFQDIVKQKFTFTHHLEISTDEGPMDTYLHGDHAMPVASMGANGARLRDAAIAPALKAPIGAPSILWAHRAPIFSLLQSTAKACGRAFCCADVPTSVAQQSSAVVAVAKTLDKTTAQVCAV